MVDSDTVGHSDLIGDFQCMFATDYRQIAADVSATDWSTTQDCDALNQKNDIK